MSPGSEALRHFIGLSEPLKAQLSPHQLHSLPCLPPMRPREEEQVDK